MSKRITVQTVGENAKRIAMLCCESLEETKQQVALKLGLDNVRLLNVHGAEIDSINLILHDDLLYATGGTNSYDQAHCHHDQGEIRESEMSRRSDIGKESNFQVGKKLGTGGQGTTFLAVDKRSNQQVVLKKVFCTGLSETNRAIEEAVMLSRLKHPRVVAYSEVFLGSDEGKANYVGIVMEYCSGGDLYHMLCKQRTKKKPLSVRRVKMWIVQMCEAIAFLHTQNVVHRDMKPMNVLVDNNGDLKIADFGLARQGVTATKLISTQCGTPGYESPEVQLGQLYGFKTDIWGLGCIVCDMTTLKFMHERPGSLATQVQVDPKAIVKVIQPVLELYGPEIHALLASMLQSDPKQRPTASEILEMKFLHNYSKGQGVAETADGKEMKASLDNSVEASPVLDRMKSNVENPKVGASPSAIPVMNAAKNENILIVSRQTGADGHYQSIMQALRNASEGATIVIFEGRYQEEIYIDKPVTLQARQVSPGEYAAVEVSNTSIRPVVICNSSNATIKGLKIRHLSQISSEGRECTRCIDIGSGALAMEDCNVKSVSGVGVVVRDGARLKATRCVVCRCGQNGFFIFGKGGAVVDSCDICENMFPGIGIDGSIETIVRKCRIRHGKGDGIKIYGSTGVVLEKNDISHNGRVGIAIEDGANPIVRQNAIHDSQSCGISILKAGKGTIEGNDIYSNAHPNVYIAKGADPVIKGNQIHHGGSCGITCVEEGLGTIHDNEIFSNLSVGIYLMNGANPRIFANEIRDSEGDGISICFAAKGVIEENIIRGNSGIGILIESEADPTITNNQVIDSQLHGIKVCHNGRGMLQGNVIRGSGWNGGGGSGIVLTTGSSPIIMGNEIDGNATHGILCIDGAAGRIEKNTISENQGNGITLTRDAKSTIKGNVVRANAGYGLYSYQAPQAVIGQNHIVNNGKGDVRAFKDDQMLADGLDQLYLDGT
eukprot:768320-Hanusia_phi.AAC.16